MCLGERALVDPFIESEVLCDELVAKEKTLLGSESQNLFDAEIDLQAAGQAIVLGDKCFWV